jgi:pimeloyl-ACP methyl ester carboxylesterase
MIHPGALALMFAGILAMTPAGASTLGELSFEPCVLTAVGLPRPTEAHCTTVTVPENPADPEGRQIELALAWVPVEGEAEPDPVFFIAGGPGQSAREAYPGLAPAFADIRRSRHVLLLDQRGTGGSQPLFCPEQEDEAFGSASRRPRWRRCARSRSAVATRCSSSPTCASTRPRRRCTISSGCASMIGAPQVNLVGVSYGTRVAQQYAKAYPERTRTIILDSVVPAELALGAEMRATCRMRWMRSLHVASRSRPAARRSGRPGGAARGRHGAAARRRAGAGALP